MNKKLKFKFNPRYQCIKCYKTFHKPGSKPFKFGSDILMTECCPYCDGNFIKV